MKVLGQLCGFLILLASLVIGGGIFTGLLPSEVFVWDVYSGLCDDGETVAAEPLKASCVDDTGTIQSDLTGTAAISSLCLIISGLVLGFTILSRFAPPRDPQALSDKFDQFADERGLQRIHTHLTPDERQALAKKQQNNPALSVRLRELDDAYEQGLLSDKEYQKARDAVLYGNAD